MKTLLVTIEGLSDTSYAELGGSTPLESAGTPNLDFFAKIGCSGVFQAIGQNFTPSPAQTLFTIYGYSPNAFPGTGVVEAMGSGVSVDGHVFGTRLMGLDAGGVAHPVSVSDEEARDLYKYVNRHLIINTTPVKMKVVPTEKGKGLFVVSGEKINNKASSPDEWFSVTFNSNNTVAERITNKFLKPFKVNPSSPLNRSSESRKTARVLNEFTVKSKALLSSHLINKKRLKKGVGPANFICLRGPNSEARGVKSISDKVGGSWCVISPDLEARGVGALVGAKALIVQGDSFPEKCLRAVNELKNEWGSHDCFHVHFSELVQPSLEGDVLGKRKLIEILDKNFFFQLTDEFELKNVKVVVASTSHVPCSTQVFESKPLPFIACGEGVESDDTNGFSEKECFKSSRQLVPAQKILITS